MNKKLIKYNKQHYLYICPAQCQFIKRCSFIYKQNLTLLIIIILQMVVSTSNFAKYILHYSNDGLRQKLNQQYFVQLLVSMHNYTAKLKQQANPKKTFTHTNKGSTSKANNSQDIESFLPLIIDLIKANEVNAQKEISQLKNETLKNKLLELNKQFQYFKYRVRTFQHFKDYLQTLFKSTLKNSLVQPNLNDYKYETGLIQAKLLEDVLRLTNNSKILYVTTIEGRKLKAEEYYQFGTENVIKYVGKINQKQLPTKTNPAINENQLYEQFMKISKGTFNRFNTKMVYFFIQKTLDLLSSINNQILKSQQKVKCQCANNNLVYYRRDQAKNLGLSRQKIQKKSQYNYLNQDQFRQQSKNIQLHRNIVNKLRKESSALTDINQRLAEQIKSKQQHFKYLQSYEISNQQNKRLSEQINKVKASNKHQLQQIRQLNQINRTMKETSDSLKMYNQTLKFDNSSLNKKLKISQAKIQDFQIYEDNNLTNSTKQLEDIKQSNKKIVQQKLMIERLQKQHIENVAEQNKLEQTNQKYKQEIAQNNKCLSQQSKERKNNLQSINKLSIQRELLLKQKEMMQLNLLEQRALKQQLNKKYLEIMKMNLAKQVKRYQLQKDAQNKRLIERGVLKKDKIELLQSKLCLIKFGVVKNAQKLEICSKKIEVSQNIHHKMNYDLLQKIVRIKQRNQQYSLQIRSLESYINFMKYNQSILSKNEIFSQKLLLLKNSNSQNYQYNLFSAQFKLDQIRTKNQQVAQSLFYLKSLQNKLNLEMISKLNHQKSSLEVFLQNLIAIQMSQRQQRFYFQKKLLKTIIFNSQKMEKIKSKINAIFGNFSGSLLECSPALLKSAIQNIQFDTNAVINYIRSIEQQITKFNEQSLEQCREIQIDD